MEKTAIFIDGGYFKEVSWKIIQRNIDFLKLIENMRGNEKLLRAYYYYCRRFVSENPSEEERVRQAKQESFFNYLYRVPHLECKFGRLERHLSDNGTSEFVQKQVDVLMAIDLVTLSTKHLITNAKIITGDSDLIPAIQVAKNEGVVVELFYCAGSTHHELLQTVDIATEINYSLLNKVIKAEQTVKL